MLLYFRQRKVVKTRNGGLANLSTESEVISIKDYPREVILLLKFALFCLLLSLLALLVK